MVYARERGWIEVGVVALANPHVWFVEFEHANGMVRAGKNETWHASLPGGFKHVIRGDNIVRQYRRPGSLHTSIRCQVNYRGHAIEGRADGIEIAHIGYRGRDVRSICCLGAIEARKAYLSPSVRMKTPPMRPLEPVTSTFNAVSDMRWRLLDYSKGRCMACSGSTVGKRGCCSSRTRNAVSMSAITADNRKPFVLGTDT